MTPFFIKVIPDAAYDSLVEETINRLVKEWKEDGFEIKTYSASLVVMETERLLIRRITRKDMDALLAIMGKPEVMYAWEHGFTKKGRAQMDKQATHPIPQGRVRIFCRHTERKRRIDRTSRSDE